MKLSEFNLKKKKELTRYLYQIDIYLAKLKYRLNFLKRYHHLGSEMEKQMLRGIIFRWEKERKAVLNKLEGIIKLERPF